MLPLNKPKPRQHRKPQVSSNQTPSYMSMMNLATSLTPRHTIPASASRSSSMPKTRRRQLRPRHNPVQAIPTSPIIIIMTKMIIMTIITPPASVASIATSIADGAITTRSTPTCIGMTTIPTTGA